MTDFKEAEERGRIINLKQRTPTEMATILGAELLKKDARIKELEEERSRLRADVSHLQKTQYALEDRVCDLRSLARDLEEILKWCLKRWPESEWGPKTTTALAKARELLGDEND